MVDTKVKQLQPNVEKVAKKGSSKEELIKRVQIKDSPFEVITQDGYSFGVMGNYRLTEKSNDAKDIEKQLKKITWNRIIQIVMILDEVKNKIKKQEEV
jgi:translation elongation factor P/translation initiation factor 5A